MAGFFYWVECPLSLEKWDVPEWWFICLFKQICRRWGYKIYARLWFL